MKTALALLALLLPSAAFGMVFRWTDSAGIAHFTNKEYEIPDRYRARAKRLYPEQADTSTPQQTPTAQQSPAAQQVTRPEVQPPVQRIITQGQPVMLQPPDSSRQLNRDARPDTVRRRRGAPPSSKEE